MQTSQSTKNIANALFEFQSKVGVVKKDGQNPFFKSTYATLSSVLETIAQPLRETGLTFTQFPDGLNGLTTRVIHAESDEWIEANYVVTPAKNDPQGQGSALTYQRRYALVAIFGLSQEDDDGNAASIKGAEKKKESVDDLDL